MNQSAQTLCCYLLAFIMVSTYSASDSHARLRSPKQELQKTEKQVRKALQTHKTDQALKQALRPIFNKLLDFNTLGEKALSKYWKKISLEEQTEFLFVLQKLIESAYLSRIKVGQSDFKVAYTAVKQNKQNAHIKAVVSTKNGPLARLGFKLKQTNYKGKPPQWKVYDLIIDDVSLVRNYRSQFNRLIQKKQFSGLMKTMKRKLRRIERKAQKNNDRTKSK